ncbi:MAG: aminotransferase class I/II-fold pyridoxal phosphate-dependent enzyme [Lachnospiraceae bacterium]|nr:aminotransferase class I/II-fold pyridoxal phosphate-dependent enzyme [Lachnospiraceae bacterium]
MISFINDYCEGAAPEILKRLEETNYVKTVGYGLDEFCKSAEDKIRKACACPEAEVYFLTGGTQTNMVTIDALTKPYEGVVATVEGHVNTHEAGAIEYSGHKVLTLPSHDGKMHATDLKDLLVTYYGDANYEHMVAPGIVYISHPTELGTIYTKAELTALHEVCAEYKIPLFLDGARLGYGLMAEGTDVTLPDIAELTDVFYIGGTKVGALFGEALVFTKHNMPYRFNTMVKQHGAMVAKGRLLGLQFDTLFTDDLYFRISRNAIETAARLKKGLKEKGYTFFLDSPTNQIFVTVTNEKMKELEEKVIFSFWGAIDADHTVIRFVTSWATRMEDVEELITIL